MCGEDREVGCEHGRSDFTAVGTMTDKCVYQAWGLGGLYGSIRLVSADALTGVLVVSRRWRLGGNYTPEILM